MTVRRLIRLLSAGLLGAGAAVLVSCGSSGAGLIPSEDAGPLVADFQAVERAATKGNGDCTPTREALHTTERDFQALPRTVDAGLRGKLHEGIVHLQGLALELCTEPLAATTGTTATAPATPPPSATTKTEPKTTSTTGEPTATSGTGGSTPTSTAPPAGSEGGTAPEAETESGGESGPGESSPEGGGEAGGAAAGAGGEHGDSGTGNSGVSGNGGTGPGAHGGGQ